MADLFFEEIADSKIDKFIMSLNAARHNEIHPIYHVDPEEELLITFEDDNLIQEEIPTPAMGRNTHPINCKRKRRYAPLY